MKLYVYDPSGRLVKLGQVADRLIRASVVPEAGSASMGRKIPATVLLQPAYAWARGFGELALASLWRAAPSVSAPIRVNGGTNRRAVVCGPQHGGSDTTPPHLRRELMSCIALDLQTIIPINMMVQAIHDLGIKWPPVRIFP